MANSYKSDIKLGETYTDTQTGITGIATGVYFYQHGCERVCIEYVHPQNGLTEIVFDAPRLKHTKSGKVATTDRTGGPGKGNELRPTPGRR